MTTVVWVIGLILGGFGIGFTVKSMYDDWFEERKRRYDICMEFFAKAPEQEEMLTALKNGVITQNEYCKFMEKKDEED